MKIYGVTGWKNSGKTSLMERLVTEFVTRGLRVSTIKHAHHSTDIDSPGRDSYRHREAGAAQTILSTPQRWALMTELRDAPEPDFDTLIAALSPCDLVLIEGYKRAPHPKIECHRAETGRDLLAYDAPGIRAVASDTLRGEVANRPVFDLNDTRAIADFIWKDLT